MALADIPGYGAFIQRRQMIEQEPLSQLQQATQARGLLASIQKQKQEDQFRSDLAALGPEPTQESLAAVASKYAAPSDVLKTHQSSLDRKEAAAAMERQRREALAAQIAQQNANAAMIHEFRMSRAATEAERNAEIARHNKVIEGIQQQNATLRADKKAAPPKPPKDFEWTDDTYTEVRPIKGGPKDTAPKDLARAQGAVQKADTVIKKVEEALDQTGFFSTGATGALLGKLPGTSAYDLDKTLDTIKSNLGFSELQAMREASPTGGALGQVAIQELAMLQSTIASMEKGQSEPNLRRGLAQVKKHFENWKRAVLEANPAAANGVVGGGAPGGAPDPIKAGAEAAWGKYEPEKYDYRMSNGRLQRKAK